MGSHASQLTQRERWCIIHYIRTTFMGLNPNKAVVDSANVENPVEVAEATQPQ